MASVWKEIPFYCWEWSYIILLVKASRTPSRDEVCWGAFLTYHFFLKSWLVIKNLKSPKQLQVTSFKIKFFKKKWIQEVTNDWFPHEFLEFGVKQNHQLFLENLYFFLRLSWDSWSMSMTLTIKVRFRKKKKKNSPQRGGKKKHTTRWWNRMQME